MDKLDKKVTFIIIDGVSSKPKKIDIPRRIIKGLVIIAFMMLLLSGVLIYQYTRYRKDSINISKLREENREQKLHLTSLTKSIESLNTRLNKLHTSNTKLQILAGIKKPENNKQIFGIGGGIDDDMFEFSFANLTRLIEQMYNELEDLEFEVTAHENELLEMTTLIEERKSILDSTPAIWPAKGWITSVFGYRKSPFTGKKAMHFGLDVSSRRGTPIFATARGVVTFSGIKGNYGKVVALSHGYGFLTIYGHNSVNLVAVGDKVERGDVIAYLGNTGRSTAPHLHYEVRINGVPVNPNYYILD